MYRISVGEPLGIDMNGWSEGSHYNYDASGHWLHIMFRKPIPREIIAVGKGDAEFSLYVVESALFLLYRFGDLPWNDAPYSWWRVSEERRKLPEIEEDRHALLKVVLVDSETGIVAALRALTFSVEFTRRLHYEIIRQSQQTWDPERHDRMVTYSYMKYSTLDMLKRGVVLCRGGD